MKSLYERLEEHLFLEIRRYNKLGATEKEGPSYEAQYILSHIYRLRKELESLKESRQVRARRILSQEG